jgi:hypothetical protein
MDLIDGNQVVLRHPHRIRHAGAVDRHHLGLIR